MQAPGTHNQKVFCSQGRTAWRTFAGELDRSWAKSPMVKNRWNAEPGFWNRKPGLSWEPSFSRVSVLEGIYILIPPTHRHFWLASIEQFISMRITVGTRVSQMLGFILSMRTWTATCCAESVNPARGPGGSANDAIRETCDGSWIPIIPSWSPHLVQESSIYILGKKQIVVHSLPGDIFWYWTWEDQVWLLPRSNISDF